MDESVCPVPNDLWFANAYGFFKLDEQDAEKTMLAYMMILCEGTFAVRYIHGTD